MFSLKTNKQKQNLLNLRKNVPVDIAILIANQQIFFLHFTLGSSDIFRAGILLPHICNWFPLYLPYTVPV